MGSYSGDRHSLAVFLLSELPEDALKLVDFLLFLNEHEILMFDGLISSCQDGGGFLELDVRLVELLLEAVCGLLLLLEAST